jgi:F-type H+-transporting ATPase subunit b
MPQLDFSTYASQIFWLFITFGILYIAMARFALPNVREVLENRRSRIINDLTKAEKLRKEAESAQAGFASSLNKAHEKAHFILQDLHTNLAEKTREAHAPQRGYPANGKSFCRSCPTYVKKTY